MTYDQSIAKVPVQQLDRETISTEERDESSLSGGVTPSPTEFVATMNNTSLPSFSSSSSDEMNLLIDDEASGSFPKEGEPARDSNQRNDSFSNFDGGEQNQQPELSDSEPTDRNDVSRESELSNNSNSADESPSHQQLSETRSSDSLSTEVNAFGTVSIDKPEESGFEYTTQQQAPDGPGEAYHRDSEVPHSTSDMTNELPPPSAAVASATQDPASTPSVAATKGAPMVIDLLDDDDGDDDEDTLEVLPPQTASAEPIIPQMQQTLRKPPPLANDRKRPRLSADPLRSGQNSSAMASYHGRNTHRPDWMQQKDNRSTQIQPGSTIPGAPIMTKPAAASLPLPRNVQHTAAPSVQLNTPVHFDYPPGFEPTWHQLLPPLQKPPPRPERRVFQLSLLNVSEFTITGLPTSYEGPPTPVSGLRSAIKSISRVHGKAVYDRDAGGKWRIPLGAYHAFAAYLDQEPLTTVHGIPQQQLQVAFLERQRQERGYPTREKLIERGLPPGLAKALAPFQRGGVDFVVSKGGRALIADDMGLGKTIQGVASMAMYIKEWPLLVLCPSSARYHWENEFQNWLGVNSNVNKPEDGDSENNLCTDMLLKDSEINVLGSSKEEIFPNESTRVVICSYGLVSVLAESGRLRPGMFPCAIVDESHMLKNKSSKRTTCLLPILMATKRCVLLSGTPALARPAELWPQLCIVGTEQNGMWDDENNFLDRYVKRGDAQSRAELHAMLTGTVMIRRLKVDILKSMPRKRREKAALSILTEEQRHKFKELLADLRRGKGALGKLARQEHEETRNKPDDTVDESFKSVATLGNAVSDIAPEDARTNGRPLIRDLEGFQNAQAQLNEQLRRDFEQGQALIRQNLELQAYHLSDEERVRVVQDLNGQLRSKVEAAFNHGMQSIHSRFGHPAAGGQNADDELAETSKKRNVLSQLYEMTGNAKIPLIVDLLKRWLADPTKGKLCIFAHHISVLDAIANNACLSNKDGEDGHKYIRIDGSTNPKVRQQQIKTFQTDPSTRIALLGITAAGVAVTLTASSTVWFAELFWTPAIMIQAEDRVHRIGQTARVQCLYFVARGSLDDVLWRLIERKFRDLGEFVEGKEKLKLVVDHTYHRLKDLHDIFHDGKFDDDNNDDDVDDQEADDEDGLDLDLAQDIENDIQAFGEEENRMLHAADNDEELSDRASPATTQTISFTEDPPPNDVGTGRTEDDAIALSDDEDETASSLAVKPQAVDTEASSPAARSVPDGPQFRSYRIYLRGPKLGLEMAIYQGRLVVSRVLESRLRIHGEEGKPAVGDIVAAFNGRQLPMLQSMQPALKNIRDCLSAGPVEMIFSEDPAFSMFYRDYLAEERRRRMELRRIQLQQQRQRQRQPPTKPDEVIEID